MNHGDIVREALNFGYGGDPNYRPFYEDGITALDALLKEVERLTAERDEAVMKKARMDNWGYSDRGLQARAEAAEREVERLTAENGRMEQEIDAMDSRRAFEWERAEAAERERDDLLTFWPDKYDELQVKVQEWATRARAAEALAERRGAAATLARSELAWCIGYASTVEHKAWRERLLKRLHVARDALADGGDGEPTCSSSTR